MNGTTRQETLRHAAVELALMACAAVVFAVLAPFGTAATPLGERMVTWLVFAIGGYLFFRPVIAGGQALSAQTRLPSWLTIPLACAIAAMPTTLLVAWMLAGHGLANAPVAALADLYPKVALVGGIVTAIQLLSDRSSPRGEAAAPAVAAPPSADPVRLLPDPEQASPMPAPATAADQTATRHPLFDQLPPAIGRDLLYIENEDHYVRVHTDGGNALLLMRMRDAVGALEEFDGARVHRSWWVARRAVTGIARNNRAISLTLIDGREIPVARPMVADLRARGWF